MLKHKDLETWEIFCAVAEAGSISGACDLCDCDAAYISRLIKNLENSIGGVELLDRTTRPLTLTEPGKIALWCSTLSPFPSFWIFRKIFRISICKFQKARAAFRSILTVLTENSMLFAVMDRMPFIRIFISCITAMLR